MSRGLIAEFDARMMDNYRRALSEVGYNSTRVLQMMFEHGGFETAHTLLATSNVSEGYTAMWERGRLDLTVEALVLEDRFSQLFTDEQLSTARTRLEQYGFTAQSTPF